MSPRTSPLVTILACATCAGLAKAADRAMVHEIVIDAPVADVWDAFTTEAGIESWMVPVAEIDLRVGGTLKTNYDAAGAIGDDTTIVHRILAYEPQRMLSMKVEQSPSDFPHEIVESTWGVITFEPLDPDRTRVRLASLGWQEGEAWDRAWAFFEAGNAMTLRALQDLFDDEADLEGADDEVWELLCSMVGGAWIHESTTDGGAVFRSRNEIRYGPARHSLVGQGWLGGADGMYEHGSTIVWRAPARADGTGGGEVRFLNINELGDVARGAIRRIGPDAVAWDWVSTAPDGTVKRFDIAMVFDGADEYRMVMRQRVGEQVVERFTVPHRRVEALPEAFRQMKGTGHRPVP